MKNKMLLFGVVQTGLAAFQLWCSQMQNILTATGLNDDFIRHFNLNTLLLYFYYAARALSTPDASSLTL